MIRRICVGWWLFHRRGCGLLGPGGSEGSSSSGSAIVSAENRGGYASERALFDVRYPERRRDLPPLAITDDDYVFYQQGQTVFVTALFPGRAGGAGGHRPGG